MENKGYFITFEGGEGCGKSTQAELLAAEFRARKIPVVLTREPGGSESAEQIRTLLKQSKNLDPITEALLMFAARREHFVHKIQPLLQKRFTIICDRFYDSSLVYQGVLGKVSIEQLMYLKNMTIGDFEPDLTFVLDVSSTTARRRVQERGLFLDHYDGMSENEYELIRNGFKKLAEIFSYRAVVIKGDGSPKAVFQKICKVLSKKIEIPY